MPFFKTRTAFLLSVLTTAASAFTGYQVFTSQRTHMASTAPQGPASQPLSAPSVGAHMARIKPGLQRELDAMAVGELAGVFAHFSSGSVVEQDALIERHGLNLGHDFRQFTDAVFVYGTAPALLKLAREPSVSYLEQNVKMRYMGETGPWATRVRVAQEAVQDGPYTDAAGNILTGAGVGVAVVDSGVNAPHPDLVNNVAKNYKVVCPTPGLISTQTGLCFGGAQIVDLGKNASSDTTGGHGTHVAGTVLGDGTASTGSYTVASAAPNQKGSFAGVAPKASLYAYGAGETLVVLSAAEAFDHILKNNDSFTPRVRVVSNSYGVGPDNGVAVEYDPADAFSQLTIALVNSGVSVVFAAGNDGDSTTNDTTSPTCKDPTPGVICVASYDDVGTGSQSGPLSDFTSQGPFNDPIKYPDIAAPGSNITSTCTQPEPGQGVCATGAETRWLPYYGTISGTSMATPHVSGAIALLYQAKPNLTPAEVERALQNAAIKLNDTVYGASRAAYVSDPQNPGGTTNYRAGAGLLDVPTLLRAQNVAHGSLPAAGERVVADGDTETGITGAADIVKVAMTEMEQGGAQGINFALTVRDVTAFGSPAASQVRYLINSNVGGTHYSSGAVLAADTGAVSPLPRGPLTNAAATAAGKVGNVINIFVPLGNMGGPAIGTPMHNIVASSFVTTSSGESAADYTPSSSATASVAATQPAFGKPYTVLNSSSAVAENICVAPGATVLTDGSGDIFFPTGQSSAEAYDIQSLSIAQPYVNDATYRLVFTLKMANLSALPPATTWPVSFCSPAFACVNPDSNTAPYSATNKYYTLRMTTDPSLATGASPATPVFQLLTPTAAGVTTGSRTTTILASGAGNSGYTTSGAISFVVDAAQIGITAPGAQSLSKFQTRVQAGGPTPDNMPDSLVGAGEYATQPPAFCSPNQLPVAVLTSDVGSGPKPLTVSFDGSQSSDPDAGDSIASYTFDFGDGSAFAVQAAAVVEHTYTRGGSYTAKLTVKDSKGAEGSTLGMVNINVSNSAPVADLKADKTSGTAPLTVAFDALASSDPDAGDSVTLYSFDLDGDGSYEITDSASAKPSFTYETAGSYVARVKVKDSEGLESAAATRTISVSEAGGPSAISIQSFTATPATADITNGPQTVNFSVSATDSDPDQGSLSYTFYFGDGSHSARQAASTISHAYSRAGDYTVLVIVADDNGNSATAETPVKMTTTITVTPGPVAAALNVSLENNRSQVPATAVLDGSGSTSYDGAIYRFSFGDGTADQVGTAKIARHVYTTPGTFTATLTVTDKDDATNTSTTSRTVTITAANQTLAQLQVSPSTVRVGETVSFDASASFAATGRKITSYTFDFGDGVTQTKAVPNPDDGSAARASHVYGRVGSFTPSVTVTDDANQTSQAKAGVKVLAPGEPLPPATPPASGDATGPVLLDGASSKGGSMPLFSLLPLALMGLRRRRR